MLVRDNSTRYGLVSRSLHWGMAVGIFVLFALGWWMVRLDYYDPYYTRAPAVHRSLGLIVLLTLVLRLAWRFASIRPQRPGLTVFERKASRLVHSAFYVLLVLLTISGYLISTADGRAVDVFGLFEVPCLVKIHSATSFAGDIHRWAAVALMGLTALHASAALKHVISRHAGDQAYRMKR